MNFKSAAVKCRNSEQCGVIEEINSDHRFVKKVIGSEQCGTLKRMNSEQCGVTEQIKFEQCDVTELFLRLPECGQILTLPRQENICSHKFPQNIKI
jgi:hypothetical protein